MKFSRLAVLALAAAAPAFAGATSFVVDFEKNWEYGNGAIATYYSGGTADDGSSGSNLGIVFVGVDGLSNDQDFTYYSNAPTSQGVAYATGSFAFMNVAAGVEDALSFSYSSPVAVTGALQAYSGQFGTGVLLGTLDLAANSSALYDGWSNVTFNFSGTARSFSLVGSVNTVAFDNISAVPEASSALMLMAGGVALLGMTRRRRG